MTLLVGDKAPNYSLKNSNTAEGEDVLSLSDSIGNRGCVVVFECNHCPYVVASVERINAMSAYCKEREIGFVGINSNDPVNYPADSFENMVKRAKKGMPYPYLHDPTQVTATAWGAERTPEFFLLDSKGVVVYHGRMDDNPRDPTQVTTSELKDSIDAMVSGIAPSVSSTESIGCSVKWK